jgi:hypothetical protein
MLKHINYHIWYKVCRPIKRKYHITTNCILILSSAYLLQVVIKKGFTLRALRSFVTYYNDKQIKYYVNTLLDLNYIVQSGEYNNHLLYSLSEIGNKVILELNDSYEIELIKFCSRYNIEL